MKRWKRPGFKSQQSYAARVGATKRRIAVINARLEALDLFDGVDSAEGASLEAEKEHLLDQIAPLPDLPDFGDLIKVLKNK